MNVSDLQPGESLRFSVTAASMTECMRIAMERCDDSKPYQKWKLDAETTPMTTAEGSVVRCDFTASLIGPIEPS